MSSRFPEWMLRIRDEIGIGLSYPERGRIHLGPHSKAVNDLLHEALIPWIRAELDTGHPGDICDRLSSLEIARITATDNSIFITMNGITGTASSARGALNHWIEQASDALLDARSFGARTVWGGLPPKDI
jgi:hypothetical protein